MKKLSYLILLFSFVIIGIILLARRNASQPVIDTHKLQVSASIYPMYYFSKQIGGEKAQVYNITPASAEPHDYEPTTQDIARIEGSNMLVLNGGALEAWGDKVKEDLQGTSTLVVTAGDTIANKVMIDQGKSMIDPHVWQSPLLAKEEVANIEKGFEKADPKDTAYFQKNAKKLGQELDQLDKDYMHGLQNCTLRDFVTSHAAFAYMAQAYHINQIAISGISPDEEPSSQKLANVANLIQKEGIHVIFFESLVSPKLSDTIAQETGASTLVLDPLEGIPQENIDKGATYFSIMQQNLKNLRIALECHE